MLFWLKHGKEVIYLGSFSTIELAIEARHKIIQTFLDAGTVPDQLYIRSTEIDKLFDDKLTDNDKTK